MPIATSKKSAGSWQNSAHGGWPLGLIIIGIAGLVLIAFLFCLGLLLGGCTVSPNIIRNSQASFDGNVQNSGIIGIDQVGNRIVTLHALERYNALIDRFGSRFSPPLQRNAGVTLTSTNTALLTAQAQFYFMTMNRWHMEGPQP